MIALFSALTLGKVVDFLKSPMCAVVGAILLAGSCFLAGHHVAAKACEEQKQASIDAARRIDRQAAQEALQRTEMQAQQNAVRAATAEDQLREYQNELQKRAGEAGCNLLDPDVERLRADPPTGRQQVAPLPPKRRAGSDAASDSKPRR